ncbi:hypothetical protein HYV70_00235 [Candidatus Uhrbacteria bacterium]|nr:hypothetical protein [Candidatus Uhrbacteria bacterium]
MNRLYLTIISLLFFCSFVLPVQAAGYKTPGVGTEIHVGADKVLIVVRMELWGDGVWDDPNLASRWEKTIEEVWNNKIGNVKYKCYDVTLDVIVIVSPKTREGADAQYGTPGFHQIWVPQVAVGDMANTYNQYGLYLKENGTTTSAYGELDDATAKAYYESNTTKEQQEAGKGKVSGYIWNPSPIGADGQKEATWGTLPNTLTDTVLTHEFGHLIGVLHDEKGCDDNVMSPSNGKTKVRTQVYPTYFKQMLDPLKLTCEWDVRTQIEMDATAVGTYFPPQISAHNEFTLREEEAAPGIASAKEPSEIIYDHIEPNFTCNVFSWQDHAGKIKYKADILYNFKEDLDKGGRLLLTPAILQEPYEEILNISGCGSGPLTSLDMVNPVNHHNILYSLTGKNLQVTPYNYHSEEPVSCPAKPEEPFIQKFYNDGFMIDGASKGSKAEHFPDADLFGAQFDYVIEVTDAQPTSAQ